MRAFGVRKRPALGEVDPNLFEKVLLGFQVAVESRRQFNHADWTEDQTVPRRLFEQVCRRFSEGWIVFEYVGCGSPIFHPAPGLTQEDVDAIVERASKRILRFLQRRGVITLLLSSSSVLYSRG